MKMNENRVGSLTFFFVGIYGLIFSFQLPLGKWNQLGAGAFPLGVSILLVMSGILWFIFGNKKKEKNAGIESSEIKTNLVTPLKIVIVSAGFVLIMNRLGYLVASSLFLFVLFFWVGRYKWWIAMCFAVVLGIASWYFFAKLLDVQLPMGVLAP
jgi:putative tricarboxylic transport membrane protein